MPKYRIHEKMIYMRQDYGPGHTEINDDEIIVREPQRGLNMLRHFCPHITQLRVRSNRKNQTALVAAIANKCAATLLNLEIHDYENFLELILPRRIHFERLNRLKIDQWKNIDVHDIAFSFERLTAIDVNTRRTNDFHFRLMQRPGLRSIFVDSMRLKAIYDVLEAVDEPSALENVSMVWSHFEREYTEPFLHKFSALRSITAYVFRVIGDQGDLIALVRSKWGEVHVESRVLNEFLIVTITRAA